MGFLDRIIAHVEALPDRVPAIAAAAAPRIEAKLREDATTRRGNVPSYGKFGSVPIAARANGETIVVTAADWVMDKAVKFGQPDEWVGIVGDEARAEFSK